MLHDARCTERVGDPVRGICAWGWSEQMICKGSSPSVICHTFPLWEVHNPTVWTYELRGCVWVCIVMPEPSGWHKWGKNLHWSTVTFSLEKPWQLCYLPESLRGPQAKHFIKMLQKVKYVKFEALLICSVVQSGIWKWGDKRLCSSSTQFHKGTAGWHWGGASWEWLIGLGLVSWRMSKNRFKFCCAEPGLDTEKKKKNPNSEKAPLWNNYGISMTV